MAISTIVTPLFLLLLCCVLHPGQKIAIDSFEPGRPTARIVAERVPEGIRILSEGHALVAVQEPHRLAFQVGDERVDLTGNLQELHAPMTGERQVIKVKDDSTFTVVRSGRKLTVTWSADPRVRLEVTETQTPLPPPPR